MESLPEREGIIIGFECQFNVQLKTSLVFSTLAAVIRPPAPKEMTPRHIASNYRYAKKLNKYRWSEIQFSQTLHSAKKDCQYDNHLFL
jgi:hypothetical protein